MSIKTHTHCLDVNKSFTSIPITQLDHAHAYIACFLNNDFLYNMSLLLSCNNITVKVSVKY